ncbi:MAG: Hpt domain-containing protein [Betaproteobacteria bacterium]|nr:MAG: Hpt domain-containing protein [Betaproteobacteria bacterium]
MSDSAETVRVARELETLIPTFLANRRRELDALRTALDAGDFAALRGIGHSMKGVGASYGFERVSAYGAQIEEGARAADRIGLAARVEAYAEHLGRLRIVYE